MPKKSDTKNLETLAVEILSPVEHDGERLAVGTQLAIEKRAAEELIALGAAKATAPIAPPAQA